MMLKSIFVFAFSLFTLSVLAQGEVRGAVKDLESGELLPFVRIKVEELNKNTQTDFDGEYSVSIPGGNYTFTFSLPMEGFIDQTKEVAVVEGEIVVLNIELSKDSAVVNIESVKVVAKKIEGAKTIEADDIRRQNAQGATDGMSTEQITNTGASSAVEAAAQVPGISIEDGKSVYVRGLGDRYTKTILNGMTIPGLDPDRNAVQMDIFPATVIDNMTVYKTFTPNLSGDFTGGLVDITTKDFPNKRTLYVKVGLGYNTEATFNPDYISYEGGKLDFLGFDDGTRALPIRKTDKFIDPAVGDSKLTTLTSSFSDVMAAQKSSNFLNQNYAFSYGDRIKLNKNGKRPADYGYNFVLNYRNVHNYYDSVQFNEFRKKTDPSDNEMERYRSSTGPLGENDVMWTALLGQSYKVGRNKFSLVLFHTQNGKSSASQLREVNYEINPATLVKQSLQYTQRSVSNANLSGRHFLDSTGRWKLDWKLSPTYSKIVDPDIRSTVLEELEDLGPNGEVQYGLTQSVGSEIRRMYRYLNEYNLSGRFDFTYKFKQWSDLESELSFGGLNTYKQRTFDVYNYVFDLENTITVPNDPDYFFQDENIWTPETDKGTYGKGERELANSFVSSQMISGFYVMNELPITSAFKATYGARVERAVNKYTGQNNQGTVIFTDSVVLNNINVLPSLNLVYKIEKDEDTESNKHKRYTNIRGAYTTTVARPSFKEKSISQIYDPIQGRRYNGNIDLLQTTIHNADLRWEYFYGRTELVSASVFYKRFINPIELVSFYTAPNEVQPNNAGVADVYGAELELRKSIGFKNSVEKSLVLGTNLTYVISRIDMNKVTVTTAGTTVTEKEIREANAREGEVIGDYRPMYGQSPYIVNAFVTYKDDSLGLTVNLSYNVQGEKLAVIGVGSIPDVYEVPFHNLSLKVSQKFGKDQRWQASLTGKNLLMNARRRFYQSYEATPQIYDYYYQGMTITGSISYLLQSNKK